MARRMDASEGLRTLYWKLRLYIKAFPLLSKQNWSAQRLMDDYFRSEKSKMVFTSILADFFTEPRDFPGLGVFALNPEASFDKRIHLEVDKDTAQLRYYSVLGGIGSLVDVLVTRIEAHGGQVLTGRPVSRIMVEEGRATGVVDAAGEYTSADAVIASGGAKELLLDLVGEEHLPAEFVGRGSEHPLDGLGVHDPPGCRF